MASTTGLWHHPASLRTVHRLLDDPTLPVVLVFVLAVLIVGWLLQP